MNVNVHTKNLKNITISNVLQVSITHTGNSIDDHDYNTLQIIYLDNVLNKRKYMIRLKEISTVIILK